ncbi:DUF952 domain-containing protein [Rhodococcus tibetensis]|uniref:DUF952 domain-containing protein n=1 Tax=Rhodococcus tibetensis TaxID=2965064 RepID=A0ABT1QIZ2_9NOCA|nr:DUF952 domain-containing protein [Rhodococcus sp. FXJ9.536]MCQ4122259.1 DUF952 domain-containing protein [Rhodococcus sp. FXJ9.536]
MNSEQPLVHICSRDDWQVATRSGRRVPETFGADGFVHLSTPAQVHLPANRLFAGRTDLVVLWLDPTALGSPVKWEPGVPTDPSSMRFPHLYGPLPSAAVMAVEHYRPGADGRFSALA